MIIIKNLEIYKKINDLYTNSECIQLMLGFKNNLLFYGNNDLMYYSGDDFTINKYLDEERKIGFPYSSIPEHVERVFFNKINFVNQILDYNKTYIKINDNYISKLVVYRDNLDVFLQTRILNNDFLEPTNILLNRREIEDYLNYGSLGNSLINKYSKVFICDICCNTYSPELPSFSKILEDEKEKIRNIDLDLDECYKRQVKELIYLIDKLDYVEPFKLVSNKLMIKFNNNGNVEVEAIDIIYINKDTYKLIIYPLPIKMDTLDEIRKKVDLNNIKTCRSPNISLALNKNITCEQLNKEDIKIIIKSI